MKSIYLFVLLSLIAISCKHNPDGPVDTVPGEIKAISPTEISACTIVRIIGKNFGVKSNSSYVMFNNLKSTEYYTWNDTIIDCNVPLGTIDGTLIIYKDNKPSNEVPYKVINIDDGFKAYWTAYTKSNTGLYRVWGSHLEKDNLGNIWACSEAGLIKFDGQIWVEFRSVNSNLKNDSIMSIVIDKNNTLWFFDRAGNFGNYSVGNFVYLDTISATPHNYFWIPSMVIDKNNTIWIGTQQNGLYRYKNNKMENLNTITELKNVKYINKMAIDSKNVLWIGTSDGLVSFDGSNWRRYSAGNGELPVKSISSLMVDNNDNLWFTSYDTKGIFKFRDMIWEKVNVITDALSSADSYEVLGSDQCFSWFHSSEGWRKYIIRFDGNAVIKYSSLIWNPMYDGGGFSSFLMDNSGNRWFSRSNNDVVKMRYVIK